MTVGARIGVVGMVTTNPVRGTDPLQRAVGVSDEVVPESPVVL